MVEFHLDEKRKLKSYLKGLKCYDFDNTLALLHELFRNIELNDPEVEDLIFDLLKSMGAPKFGNLSAPDLKLASEYYHELMNQSNSNFDPEKSSYLFLSALSSNQICLLIDNDIITDFERKIKITDYSVISIIDQQKIKSIKFKSL